MHACVRAPFSLFLDYFYLSLQAPKEPPAKPTHRTEIHWEINQEEIEPFLYFDASITHRTGHIKKDRMEALLFSLGDLCYREVCMFSSGIRKGRGVKTAPFLPNTGHGEPPVTPFAEHRCKTFWSDSGFHEVGHQRHLILWKVQKGLRFVLVCREPQGVDKLLHTYAAGSTVCSKCIPLAQPPAHCCKDRSTSSPLVSDCGSSDLVDLLGRSCEVHAAAHQALFVRNHYQGGGGGGGGWVGPTEGRLFQFEFPSAKFWVKNFFWVGGSQSQKPPPPPVNRVWGAQHATVCWRSPGATGQSAASRLRHCKSHRM